MSSSCGSIPVITRTSARHALTTDSSHPVDFKPGKPAVQPERGALTGSRRSSHDRISVRRHRQGARRKGDGYLDKRRLRAPAYSPAGENVRGVRKLANTFL